MTTNKNTSSILGSVFIGMMLISLAGFALLFVGLYELADSGRTVSSLVQTYFSFREALQNNSGNEFTGEATGWLFGAASVPVFVDLISRAVIRYMPIEGSLKNFVRRANNFQKKNLMFLHTYLSIAALGLGILHLTLSSCIANPFPELGLILTGVLVTTGLLFKWKVVPAFLRKALYKFHASLMVTGVLLVILYIGHAVMGSD
jgi:hypothetical protein